MIGWLVVFLLIFIAFKLVTSKRTKVKKMTAFDEFLIKKHNESEENAKLIPEIKIKTTLEIEADKEFDFVTDMYINMILEGKYDIEGLKKEAMEALGVNEAGLELLIANYKK